ncbi:HTH domain-containing protein [Acinetobacter sp. ANC 4648]|uniref:HTH domain-containing protein n=1 Tax=Acinetobacter sp. ANC 4648 TaxID=1977875 RepID=UPI000A34C365|nr:HTH domain-containing protein [Acinetobacter sp. ANC 4648]OTG82182.1 DNA-binding protein [Acinetobacter sp. ANC 4648]
MTRLSKYMVMIESNTPLNIILGQNIGGGVVKELKEIEIELVSASQLAQKYNLSTTTIREHLVSINQGTQGKALYHPSLAHDILTTKNKRGRPRAN